ncbi:ABC transporter [Mycolicibacterium sp. HK-90]|uniref:ABC transporter n=1 Tax=Mycolicibacterium sp. HK-90 TaxID=3056937 RepID=UPI0026591FEF|nr:ABC transporter [Mycolicibacterium sp. HK-90]WKG02902.1 ABC transporter [Mycolicibacterium sp. HK-90]
MRTLLTLLAALVLLVGCSASEEAAAPTTSASAAAAHDDTGIDANESAEPVTRLVLVEPDTGAAVVFDAGDETETPLGAFGPTSGVSGDGRFAYLRGDAAMTVLDAGSWTFDHGDHSHYYVEPPAVAGRVDGRFADATGRRELTTLRREDGTVEILDRDALGEHRVAPVDDFGELRDIVAAAPLGEKVIAVNRAGTVTEISGGTRDLGRCPDATAAATMGREVVVGCSDGAVRIVKRAGRLTAEAFPLAAGTRPPGPLVHRYGSSALAGITEDTVWVLDARRGAWKSVDVAGAVAANTVSGDAVLVLTADGGLRAFDTGTGAQTAVLQLFGGPLPVSGPAPVIEVDADRAYVNDVAARAVYEIDYRDGLRLARTFNTSVAPGFMVEAGR